MKTPIELTVAARAVPVERAHEKLYAKAGFSIFEQRKRSVPLREMFGLAVCLRKC